MTPENDRKETGKASAESAGLYQLLAENSTEIISKHTPEGVYTYASPACRSLLGYEPEELVGRSAYEFFHPEDLERISNTHLAIIERPDVYTVSYRIRRKDGSYTWFETNSRTVREPETGGGLEIVAVSRDITERKLAEEVLRKGQEALRKSEEFHRFAVEAGRIGTWDLDLQTEECLLSSKMAELMGFSPDQTIVPGPQWRGSIVPDDRPLMASALAASIESDAPLDLEFRIALKDGTERWLYSRGGVSRGVSGKALRVHGTSIDVTERKRAEEESRESEERLRRAIEIETVGVIFFNTGGSITNANDAFLRMSGYSREDLVEGLLRWDKMTPPEWMPHSLKAIEEFKSTGRTIPYEKEYIRKDGSRWWALFAATRLDEEEGVEFIIDITKSKRAEEALRESEERFRSAFESAPIGMALVKLDGRWLEVNDPVCELLGYSRKELLRTSFQKLTHPDDLEVDLEHLRRLLRGEIRSYLLEKRYIHKEGHVVWGLLSASLVRNGEGAPLYALAQIQDISQSKRDKEELERLNLQNESILKSAGEGIFGLDRKKRVMFVNPSGARMLGYEPEEVVHRDMHSVTHHTKPDGTPCSDEECPIYAAFEDGSVHHRSDEMFWRKDGTSFPVEYVSTPIEVDGEVVGAVVTFSDITDRKQAEEALTQALRARTEFLAEVSHELRTPLTVIRGNAEVSLRLGRDWGHADLLAEIVKEAGRMSRMVEDLLFLARSDSESLPLDLETVPVARLLGGLARRAEALARKHGASLQTALSSEGSLRCDPERIEQAVLALVDNAVKYGPPGEPIALSASTRPGELLIEVADRGPGIPPEELPRIFERYYRGEGSSQERGSGPGLCIAKTIAGAHGGSLEAESRLGEGTRMFLRLPLANGS
jgi:PAS domain S-box-containing protein